jgi:hypothetical protein
MVLGQAAAPVDEQAEGGQHLIVGVSEVSPGARLSYLAVKVQCCAKSISASDCRHVSGQQCLQSPPEVAVCYGICFRYFRSAKEVLQIAVNTSSSSFARWIRHSEILPPSICPSASLIASFRHRAGKSIEKLTSAGSGKLADTTSQLATYCRWKSRRPHL